MGSFESVIEIILAPSCFMILSTILRYPVISQFPLTSLSPHPRNNTNVIFYLKFIIWILFIHNFMVY